MDLPAQLDRARLVLVILFFAMILVILIFDIWAWAWYGREASASHLIHQWSKDWPLLPFIAGGVIFHLFW